MTVKIIKKGPSKFTRTCGTCATEFSYEPEDICGDSVDCPSCGNLVRHVRQLALLNNPFMTPWRSTTKKG